MHNGIDYYEVKGFVSNSDLGKLDKELKGKPPLHVTPAMELGRELHQALLEPEKHSDFKDHPLVLQYTKSRIYQAILATTYKELEFYKNLEIKTKFTRFRKNVRCKADMVSKHTSQIYDTKFMSKAPTKPKDTIQWLNYDRQAAFYMDIIDKDRFTFIFAPNLTYTIIRGDELYNSGKQKYTELIHKHWLLFGE